MLIHLILADVICEQPPSESVAHKVKVKIHEPDLVGEDNDDPGVELNEKVSR